MDFGNLLVRIPGSRRPERSYAIEVVHREFLEVDVDIVPDDRSDWCLTDREGRRSLILPDCFLSVSTENWLEPDSVPSQTRGHWDSVRLAKATACDGPLPIIFGERNSEGHWYDKTGSDEHYLGVDVYGATFFMLSRYEELVNPTRDRHARFPAEASMAFREDFLHRPVIDEYVELLWEAMKRLWSGLSRDRGIYRVRLTHDVDRPFAARGRQPDEVAQSLLGDVVKRGRPGLAVRRLASLLLPPEWGLRLDPNFTFDWLMDRAEERDLTAAFYFVAGGSTEFDPGYDISSALIRRLMKRIDARGHEIGLHPSYATLGDLGRLRLEAEALRNAMASVGLSPSSVGGRQHYLRWDAMNSWSQWQQAGLAYDSTLGYAQAAGFRSGTCREYPTWSFSEGRQLSLRERPLIVMDRTLFADQYLGLDWHRALRKVAELADACRSVRGTFVLLWHNDHLLRPSDRRFFEDLLDVVVE